MRKVLVLEDESSIRSFIVINLRRAGYDVIEAETGEEALERLKENPNTKVALLDIMLPGIDGFEVCRRIRATNTKIGIIMLTARDTEMDEIKALELGVNDYLSKPFSLGVLKARMKRILNEKVETTNLCSGNIVIDKSTCKVYKDEEEIALSKLEYKLLMYLIENKNHVLSKEQILSQIWDSDGKYVDNNTVSVNISRLRTKIEDDASDPKFIKTVHGVGYIWKE